MKKLIGSVTVAAFLVGVVATSAAAQLLGNGTYAAMPGTGVTIWGDYALSMNDDAKFDVNGTLESASFGGGRIELGLPMFGVWAGAGSYPIGVTDVSGKIGFGGGAGFHVFNAPLTPVSVSIQAGVGYYKNSDEADAKFLKVPFGALIAINVPTTGIGVTPWVYPRGEYITFGEAGFDTIGKVGFGVSGGLMVTAPMGLGVQGSLDWLSVSDLFGEGTGSWKPLTLSFGLHYKIKVPSLGM